SASQFNHVITAVKRGDNTWTYLDTTPEVAPFGLLFGGLRDRSALLVSEGSASRLISTPAMPPFDPYDHFTLKGKLDPSRTLDADVEQEVRGDGEFLLRLVFRKTPESKWREMVQAVSYASGFTGDVSEVSVSDPNATGNALQIRYHYHRKSYGDWQNHR